MDRRFVVAIALLGLAAAAYPGVGAPPAPPQERHVTLEVTATSCPYAHAGEYLCLAYGGQVPGPTLDANLGDTLVVTLVNRIADTVWSTNASLATKARLANASVSWHVHGTALANDMDGVDAQPGTDLVASVAGPGASFTYRARAAFAGAWHYHDHVLGFDGSEGVARGLYGGLVVRNGAEVRPDVTLDLHMLDTGANGGRGLVSTAAAGSDIEILVVGLENVIWQVELRDGAGAALWTYEVGPGMSARYLIEDAQPGAYTWRATGAGARSGQVIVS